MWHQNKSLIAYFIAVTLLVGCNSDVTFNRAVVTSASDSHEPSLNAGPDLPVAQALSATNDQWLTEIQQCIDHLTQNKYVLGRNDLDCTNGTAELDCSGFINDVEEAYFPAAYKELTTRAHGRPTVSTYYTALSETSKGSSLIPLTAITDLEPGDLIMWEYTKAQQAKMDATGHMMLVLAAPISLAASGATSKGRSALSSAGDLVFKVLVADSAESGHDDDTRPNGQTGLGIGSIWFETNSALIPIGYNWTSPDDFDTSSPIAMGRMTVETTN